jgi:hypothetical protein
LTREWDYYEASGGRQPVEKELRKLKLTKWEAGRLDEAMKRLAEGRGRPGIDFKPLRDGVSECLVDGHNRTFRLFYADLSPRPVLLALHFISKKRQVARTAIDLAVDRLREWSSRQDDPPA